LKKKTKRSRRSGKLFKKDSSISGTFRCKSSLIDKNRLFEILLADFCCFKVNFFVAAIFFVNLFFQLKQSSSISFSRAGGKFLREAHELLTAGFWTGQRPAFNNISWTLGVKFDPRGKV
jgi:hypothetical protein